MHQLAVWRLRVPRRNRVVRRGTRGPRSGSSCAGPDRLPAVEAADPRRISRHDRPSKTIDAAGPSAGFDSARHSRVRRRRRLSRPDQRASAWAQHADRRLCAPPRSTSFARSAPERRRLRHADARRPVRRHHRSPAAIHAISRLRPKCSRRAARSSSSAPDAATRSPACGRTSCTPGSCPPSYASDSPSSWTANAKRDLERLPRPRRRRHHRAGGSTPSAHSIKWLKLCGYLVAGHTQGKTRDRRRRPRHAVTRTAAEQSRALSETTNGLLCVGRQSGSQASSRSEGRGWRRHGAVQQRHHATIRAPSKRRAAELCPLSPGSALLTVERN